MTRSAWSSFKAAAKPVVEAQGSMTDHERQVVENAEEVIRKAHNDCLAFNFGRLDSDMLEGIDYGKDAAAGFDELRQIYLRGQLDKPRYMAARKKARAIATLARKVRISEQHPGC